jgi:hypothetical protein
MTAKRIPFYSIFTFIALFLFKTGLFAQAENVDISHRVYDFLNRLEIKGIITNYSNSNIPLSRKEITDYILLLTKKQNSLNDIEKKILNDLQIEFEYDLKKTDNLPVELFSERNSFIDGLKGIFSDKPKYTYSFVDSSNSFFIKTLVSGEMRDGKTTGEESKNAVLATWGGSIRGTLENKFGYSLIATNGQVFGDKDFAKLDLALKGNYKINEKDAVNFDFTEGYVTYNSKIVNFEIGRDKLSIGTGYIDKIIVNPLSPSFDMVKASVKYGKVHYTFVHASLLEKTIPMMLELPEDKRVINPKYLALHRFEASLFDNKLDIGLSEMAIYGKRPVELAYCTPLIFYKSVEHSMQDRDNSLMVMDAKLRLFSSLEVFGSFLIDDITFGKIGTNWWANLFTYQGGGRFVDCFNIENLDLLLEYTRIDPYTYTHRVEGNNYTNNIYPIGPNLQPNSDKISISPIYYFSNRLNINLVYSYIRHGSNIKDENNAVIRNVGGDLNFGHRSIDSEEAEFLDGDLEKINDFRISVSFEPLKDIFFLAQYEYIKTVNDRSSLSDNFLSIKLKLNY